ncbi:MAG: TIGR03617 family F420-dependent LLM class oxidoreductase [Anaerolineae bacterium]|nr:MAG: TIGR03617 family F420-dependent LLM class oxidoreductase [Anaerolineae bacterium]
MFVDTTLGPIGLKHIPAIARSVEAMGFDALWSTETQHDPFLPGALIAEHTQKLQFGTAIAVGFARSPATMAYTAWDLASASEGRFILGLGTQVKAHIKRRFGMEWPDSPVGKFREQIQAIRTFWDAWQMGEKLDFQGKYYRLNLMTPFFNPGPIEHPEIPIYIAGVNIAMARLAGEVADGFHVHPFHTPRYLREVLIPAIEEGAQRSGRPRARLSTTVFVATTPEETAYARQQIAFYASTPSYRAVMRLHGWETEAEKLSMLAARGRWTEMPALISEEMLNTFAVVAAPEEVPHILLERYRGLSDRLTLYMPYIPGKRDAFWKHLITTLHNG